MPTDKADAFESFPSNALNQRMEIPYFLRYLQLFRCIVLALSGGEYLESYFCYLNKGSRKKVMHQEEKRLTSGGNFHLNKWFLDFTGENGEAMIFYAAKLTWHGLTTFYTSWLRYNTASGVRLKSRFRNVQFPEMRNNLISWSDSKFGVSGTWESAAKTIQTRLLDLEEGYLDWKCYQPASKVQLRINDRVLEGKGYAEQLILTVPPWKIPMDELRWGRFGSDGINLVWIELQEKEKLQWLWLNGEKIENCIIEDDHISIPEKDLVLKLDRGVVLESEKKIFSVVENLIRLIPGFNKIIPLSFLMADEIKWLSKGEFQAQGKTIAGGMAIHELVNFKASQP